MANTVTEKKSIAEMVHEHRLAITATAVPLMTMGFASASVNFSPIQELLQSVIDLIPTFMDLVVAIAPLIVVIAVIGFVIAFLDKILAMLKF